MSELRQQWRDFICDPSRPGRHLSGIGGTADEAAEALDPASLSTFLNRLSGGGADADLLAEAIDLSRPEYERFCVQYLPLLLDALSNERIGEDAVVGPGLRGSPRWDRTLIGRRSGRLPPAHYYSRIPVRSFALPENLLVRWLVGSLAGGVKKIERRLGSEGLPSRFAAIRQRCAAALDHPWFSHVPVPSIPTVAMITAAERQRLLPYRKAAALAERRARREVGDRASRWLRTLDLLHANWLAPVHVDDLFELYALVLVMDVLERELGLGPPTQYGLAVRGRDHVALYGDLERGVRIFFDQSPSTTMGFQSHYRAILDAHTGIIGNARRPDISVARTTGTGVAPVVALVEVKRTADSGYMSDSVYKAIGYVWDFQAMWDVGSPRPKVILVFPEGIAPKPTTDLASIDVAMISSGDRGTLASALRGRLSL